MTPKKKKAKKRPASKTATSKKKKTVKKTMKAAKKRARKVVRSSSRAFSRERLPALPGGQAGDLQGLSSRERADSESVEELVDEGNAFEADVVTGVEAADDADEKEVHTHEVPEDDVPGEYLDKDS
jgi:hypothetical protein